ncbi:MAG: hypothetical protein ACE5EE_05415 [Fidelibacterota bacterium]
MITYYFRTITRTPLRLAVLTIVSITLQASFGGIALAHEPTPHIHDQGHLHFSHPLVAESPSPDTKVRFDYFFSNEPGEEGVKRHTLRLESEYAFAPWLSLEADVPYTFLNTNEGNATDRLDNVEVGIKYANFTLGEHGVLLGGGIEFGLPTGNEERGIGFDRVLEVEPFVDLGYRRDHWEIVGFTSFGFPFNDNDEDEADFELGWNVSILYYLIPQLMTLLEFDGEHVFGGEEDGETFVNITPGFKIQPFDNPSFQVGVGVSLPLTEDKEFHVRPVLSLFYHF